MWMVAKYNNSKQVKLAFGQYVSCMIGAIHS